MDARLRWAGVHNKSDIKVKQGLTGQVQNLVVFRN